MEEEVAQRLMGRGSFHSTIHIFFKMYYQAARVIQTTGTESSHSGKPTCYLFLTFPALHRFVIFSGCSSTDHVRKDQL